MKSRDLKSEADKLELEIAEELADANKEN